MTKNTTPKSPVHHDVPMLNLAIQPAKTSVLKKVLQIDARGGTCIEQEQLSKEKALADAAEEEKITLD